MIYKCPCCGKYLNTENIIASYDEITDTIVQVGGECNTCGKVRIDNWEFDDFIEKGIEHHTNGIEPYGFINEGSSSTTTK